LSKALADTQVDIRYHAKWSCIPEIVMASERQIQWLGNQNFNAMCQSHKALVNGDLIQGDCRRHDIPVYFSQNNRSLYALKMVKSLFDCEMHVPVKRRPSNCLSPNHVFDIKKVGLEGAGRIGLRFYTDDRSTMYDPNRRDIQKKRKETPKEHPSKIAVEAVFPGWQTKPNEFVGYFNKTNFLNVVKAKMTEMGLDAKWFDPVSDIELAMKQLKLSKKKQSPWRRRMLLQAEF